MAYSGGIRDHSFRYDDKCSIDSQCTIPFTIEKDIYGPVYVYYRIKGFY